MSQWFSDDHEVNSVPIDDRAFQYGDGLFETIAVRNGEARLLPLHLERLVGGCDRLGMGAPSPRDLLGSLRSAISACSIPTEFATAKIVVSAGSGPRGYRRSGDSKSRFWIGIFESQPRDADDYRNGIEARLCRTRLAIQPQLAGLKTTNRLEQVLARSEWTEPQIAEGLMQDTAGNLICGTMSNVFVVTGNSIATPAITGCGVAGVMRRHILTLLADAGKGVDVREIPVAELREADEVFLTNSQFGVLPVNSCDRQHLPVGPMTHQVLALAADSGISECGR